MHFFSISAPMDSGKEILKRSEDSERVSQTVRAININTKTLEKREKHRATCGRQFRVSRERYTKNYCKNKLAKCRHGKEKHKFL